mmetsp:Transcript_24993/g.71820  ORF Transcript_24993/g.71820 Transcript_24993/m.71820 type:complete len:248 (-) Transcript_24993:9-752(-)
MVAVCTLQAPGAAAALPSARIAHRDAGGRRRQALVWRSDGAAAHRRGAGAALALRRGRDAARGSGAGHGRGRASAADGDTRGGAPRARREGVRYGGGGGGAPQGARQGRLARQPHTRRGEPSQPLVIRPVMRLRSVLPPRQACVSPLPSVFQVWEIVPIAVTRHPGRKPLGRCPCLCGHSDVSRLVAAVCQSGPVCVSRSAPSVWRAGASRRLMHRPRTAHVRGVGDAPLRGEIDLLLQQYSRKKQD